MSAAMKPEPFAERARVPSSLSEAERLQYLEEAIAREGIGGRWRTQHVMAVLDLSRATVYRTPWLMRLRRHRGGSRAVEWIPAEVRAGQERASTARRIPRRPR